MRPTVEFWLAKQASERIAKQISFFIKMTKDIMDSRACSSQEALVKIIDKSGTVVYTENKINSDILGGFLILFGIITIETENTDATTTKNR